MGYKVTLDVGPRYTGCKELIPGTVYTDNKGNELLFVGYCHVVRDEGTDFFLGNFDTFVYAKVPQLQKKMAKELLSKDMICTNISEMIFLLPVCFICPKSPEFW